MEKLKVSETIVHGDFNANGTVDGADFVIWNQFKFQTADGAVAAVPEPQSLWLGIAAVFCVVCVRRRF
jgi:hypothetical protein